MIEPEKVYQPYSELLKENERLRAEAAAYRKLLLDFVSGDLYMTNVEKALESDVGKDMLNLVEGTKNAISSLERCGYDWMLDGDGVLVPVKEALEKIKGSL